MREVKSTEFRVQLRNQRHPDVASLEEAKVVESGSLSSTISMRTRPTNCGGSVTCMPGSLF